MFKPSVTFLTREMYVDGWARTRISNFIWRKSIKWC